MCTPRNNLYPLACAVLLLSACAISRAPDTGSGLIETVTVQVDNREFANVRIYLVRNGANLLLGRIDGLTNRSFVVPGAWTGEFGLFAVTAAGRDTLRSPTVTAGPSQVVSWRIEHASRGSAILVK
jgi:hypothetical protein